MTSLRLRLHRWAHRLRRLRSIPTREVVDLVVAQIALVRAWAMVRTRPVGTLVRPVSGAGTTDPDAEGVARLDALGLAVERAAENGLFRPTCLVRAVALERLIDRSGIRGAVVRIGVLPGPTGLLAHAWIELQGTVVGDRPEHVRRFEPLHDFSALAR